MPPQLIDSDSEPEVTKQTKKAQDVDEDMEDEDEDEVEEEDEYIVEAIKDHKWRGKELVLLVKWKGYDEPTDMTWEPESNCAGAQEVVDEYFKSIGGRPQHGSAGNKRGRPSGTPQQSDKKTKRGRLSTSASVDTPSTNKRASPAVEKWKPSEKEDWEKTVEQIDTVEKTSTGLVCYLHWKNGQKSQHPIEVVYKKCPQKMLRFYEQHLVFKVSEFDGADANQDYNSE